jgi:hypothetical protein
MIKPMCISKPFKFEIGVVHLGVKKNLRVFLKLIHTAGLGPMSSLGSGSPSSVQAPTVKLVMRS